MVNFVALAAGTLFSVGLAVSGMTRPGKVVGFLDVFGDWDPSLAFVMGGAVLLNLGLFRFILGRPNPVFAGRFYVPTSREIDMPLIVGAGIFGIGWGIGGICPGPGLAGLLTLDSTFLVFLATLILGMLARQWQVSR